MAAADTTEPRSASQATSRQTPTKEQKAKARENNMTAAPRHRAAASSGSNARFSTASSRAASASASSSPAKARTASSPASDKGNAATRRSHLRQGARRRRSGWSTGPLTGKGILRTSFAWPFSVATSRLRSARNSR